MNGWLFIDQYNPNYYKYKMIEGQVFIALLLMGFDL
jgi:hypothetical protein